MIHGLDELVNFYRTNPNSRLQHSLNDFVPGSLCPISVRLHGTENLLHRASAGGNVTVVSELLKSGYRNLTAKNHDGQSAIHLATFFGHCGVLRELIQHGANVNVTDSSGYTPLHFAAQANQPEAMEILLDKGKANPVIRNQVTGWIPLHEAAWKGYLDCVDVLLRWKSPKRPRTPKDETPMDLALSNGHHDVARFLDYYSRPTDDDDEDEHSDSPKKDKDASLCHGPISRSEAIVLLNMHNRGDGTFLIRKSAKRKNVFVLSMLFDMKTHHFEIVKQGIFFFLDKGPYLDSLSHLVEHYTNFADGLPHALRHPISVDKIEASPRVPYRQKNLAHPSNLKPIDNKKLYENNDTLRRVRHSQDNVPVENIQIGSVIGEGEFGAVCEGKYVDENNVVKNVAVKLLHNMEKEQKEEFLREAELMMRLDHQCVVRLMGTFISFTFKC